MAKAVKKVKPKPSKRANKYDEKLTINGSFEDLTKAWVNPKQSAKKK